MIKKCVCGNRFVPKRENQRYCSKKCQHIQRKIDSEAKRKRICKNCGREFISHFKGGKGYKGEVNEGLFCSRDCRWEWVKSQPKKEYPSCNVYFIKCRACSKLFTTSKKLEKYCSEGCRYNQTLKRLRQKYRKENKLKLRNVKCEYCGMEFKTWYSKQQCCSDICSLKYYNKQRRGKIKGGFIENISLVKLFFRDNGRCQLCGKKLNLKRVVPHPLAPTIDHIIPLSKDGEHSYQNVQLVCFYCNSIKGDRVSVGGEQLRLF